MHRRSASADVFHVIADQTRRGILDILADGERPAKELEARFSISQPSISKHLAVLKEARLVSQRQGGRLRIYRLEADGLQESFDWVRHYEKFWDLKLEGLGRPQTLAEWLMPNNFEPVNGHYYGRADCLSPVNGVYFYASR